MKEDNFSVFLETLAKANERHALPGNVLKIITEAFESVAINEKHTNSLFRSILATLDSQTATLNHVSQVMNGFDTRLTTLEREVERLQDKLHTPAHEQGQCGPG